MKKINVTELPVYLKEINRNKNIVICNIAGKDSICAIIKYFKQNSAKYLLPVFMQTGTLIEDYKRYDKNLKLLCKNLNLKNCPELLVIDIRALWKTLNGRFLQYLVNEFKFVPVCIGCHFLIYLISGTIAYFLNSNVVIGGERKKHEDSIKINQLDFCIQFYKDILAKLLNIKLLFPIEDIVNDKEIIGIMNYNYKTIDWQTDCVLRKNYLLSNGKVDYNKNNINRYLNLYLKPFSKLFFNHFKKKYKRNLYLDINEIQKKLESIL